MCGIFFSLSRHGYVAPNTETKRLLRNRGPDSIGTRQTQIPLDVTNEEREASSPIYLTFVSTVLALRGTSVVEQPLHDDVSNSVLCWNGEAWALDGDAIVGNDSQQVFAALLATSGSVEFCGRQSSIQRVVAFFSIISGPYALVYYDAQNRYLYYARDCLGRRSLLCSTATPDQLLLSSVCNSNGGAWAEVEADGVYVVDLNTFSTDSSSAPTLIPRPASKEHEVAHVSLTSPFPAINRSVINNFDPSASQFVDSLRQSLRRSTELRVQHVREAVDLVDAGESSTSVAILFSGGLDCTLLARMCHDLLPLSENIDLLNVAFQNPRIHGKLDPGVSPYALCPDRITGHNSYEELQRVCPGRTWRFVEVDVPYTETVAHRTKVMTLMHPHNTEMDLSISYALYFASKGKGHIQADTNTPKIEYSTSAHVLLSGLGADELFGGYQRHATAYARKGHTGLIDELELDFSRIGKRNLGRDDRVISDSGKEVRFPFLDENLIALALSLPVQAKCDFAIPELSGTNNTSQVLEPAKRILRLLAWQLGMTRVATEKKRAIQFGTRTAKMETGKSKGTQALV